MLGFREKLFRPNIESAKEKQKKKKNTQRCSLVKLNTTHKTVMLSASPAIYVNLYFSILASAKTFLLQRKINIQGGITTLVAGLPRKSYLQMSTMNYQQSLNTADFFLASNNHF